MALYISSLNSGSNGNCYYVSSHSDAILIDVGLKCIEVERRLKNLNLDIKKIKAIFISHEHSDHTNGLSVLSKKYLIPTYITPLTLKSCKMSLQQNLLHAFSHESEIQIGTLKIIPFTKYHDAVDAHSFIISSSDISIGVMTDIGHACRQVIKYFKQCDAVFLESNYCDQMLNNGNYPIHLKQRIRSDVGHLSNQQALDLFLKFKSENLQLLILAHLSKNNNSPELVQELFQKHAGNTQIVVATRYHETKLYLVDKNSITTKLNITKNKATKQISLF